MRKLVILSALLLSTLLPKIVLAEDYFQPFVVFYPYWFVAEDGSHGGVHYNLMDAVYKKAGLKVRFQPTPYARVLTMYKDPETPFLPFAKSVGMDDPLEQQIDKCVGSNIASLTLYTLKEKIVTKPEEFQNKSIIVVRSWPLGPYEALLSDKNVKTYVSGTVLSAAKMLQIGRADYLLTYPNAANPSFERIGVDTKTLKQKILFSMEGWPMVSPTNHPESKPLCDRVREAYQTLILDGIVDKEFNMLKTDRKKVESGEFNL